MFTRSLPVLPLFLVFVLLAGCQSPSPAATGTGPAATTVATTTAVQPASLQLVNWKSVLQNDPDLEKKAAESGGSVSDIYVRYKGDKPAGEPDLFEVFYGDLNGDNKEEAVIQLHSGGTAGVIGLLVYGLTPSGPKIQATLDGYKLVPRTENGRLLVSTAVYAGWEPNCCPSGVKETVYKLQNSSLVADSERRSGYAQARPLTVSRYYELLQAKQYPEAYQFLTSAFQAANPYNAWVAGYANTQRITADVKDNMDDSVGIGLSVTEGTSTVRRFTGRWTLVYSMEKNQWLLDRAEIAAAP